LFDVDSGCGSAVLNTVLDVCDEAPNGLLEITGGDAPSLIVLSLANAPLVDENGEVPANARGLLKKSWGCGLGGSVTALSLFCNSLPKGLAALVDEAELADWTLLNGLFGAACDLPPWVGAIRPAKGLC